MPCMRPPRRVSQFLLETTGLLLRNFGYGSEAGMKLLTVNKVSCFSLGALESGVLEWICLGERVLDTCVVRLSVSSTQSSISHMKVSREEAVPISLLSILATTPSTLWRLHSRPTRKLS